MELTGYLLSICAGLALGLVGGGGSILTVPILVYFFSMEPVLATTYSLFVVGITSLAGSISHFNQKNIHFRVGLLFGLPSLAAVFIMRRYIMPAIPYHLLEAGNYRITKPMLLMFVFSVLMIIAATAMIKKGKQDGGQEIVPYNRYQLMLHGFLVGIVTGFVGVGGGFMIIPSLVLLAKLPMKKAVGTSLMIMSISCLFGVLGDIFKHTPIDYPFLAVFCAFAVGGVFTGSFLSRYIKEAKLKTSFGWFVLAIGIFILINDFFI